MVARDFNGEVTELGNLNLQQDSDDAEEDSLSFCDLPIYGDAADWEHFSRELGQTSSSSSSETEDQQYFEFFSEEWNSPHQSNENIVFCGKLISYKQPVSRYNQSSQFHTRTNRDILPWNSNKSVSVSSKSNNLNDKGRKIHGKFDFPLQKVSVLASPVKSRWYLFMFGLARFPVDKMELRDMKRRQSRKITKSGSGNGKSGLSRGKGLWRIIRALGCSGQNHASAAVKAAFGCAPQLAGE